MYRGASTLATIALAMLLLGLTACDKPDAVLEEIRSLQNQTMPAGSVIVEKTNLVRNGQTASATWEFETDWDWGKYSMWLKENIPNGYKRTAAEETSLQFRRNLPGDVYEMQFERGMSNNPLRIRVRFRASPD